MNEPRYPVNSPSAVMPGEAAAVSGVSWAAVLAGAAVAAAVSVLLLALGAGLGFASISPWLAQGPSPATFTIMAGVWLILVQWIASALGGYVTGRLRTRWPNLHTHEVFFRDTANGLITWAVATLAVVVVTGAAAALAVGHAATGAAHADAPGPYAYDVDQLFRATRPDDSASAAAAHAEAARILAAEATGGAVNVEDRLYLAEMVANRTGLAMSDAQKRVDTVIDLVRHDAKQAARAASASAIFTALAMLIGALIACVAAALGGQQRDEHP